MEEDGWERVANRVTVAPEQVQSMLRPVYGERGIDAFDMLDGGLANTNLKVILSGATEPVLLRIYVKDPASSAREAAVLKLIRSTLRGAESLALHVPDVLFVGKLEEPVPYHYSIMTWCAGTQLSATIDQLAKNEVASIGCVLGRWAANLSQLKFPWCAQFDENFQLVTDYGTPQQLTISHVQECLFGGPAGERLGQGRRDALWALVKAEVSRLAVLSDNYALLHGDFKLRNVLVDLTPNGWRPCALLDWEFACAGPSLLDLGTLLRHRELDDAFSTSVVRGFSDAGGELPHDWRQLVRLLDINALCTFLNFETLRPRLHAQITRLVERRLLEWPRLSSQGALS